MIPDRYARRRIASRFSQRGDRFYIHGKLATDPVYSACAMAIAGRRLPLLDIGCGLGILGHYLHACDALDGYLGLDNDPRKIAMGQEAAERAGLAGTLTLRQDDATSPQGLRGHVAMLDVLHYLPEERQTVLLANAVDHLSDDGVLILRTVLRDSSWRFRATVLEERFIKAVGWIPGGAQYFPTEGDIRLALEPRGIHVHFRPLFGRTPYNSWLMIASRHARSR
ncbi:class I SAM-dependent methyltransferase [Luteibacter aegosomatissinici]|uniref:class I SAM-dependent methyltransferase n=1 Tax=Luteibacter aegosomatissinici TaxID=2911539 RepID=UPI001FF9E0BA|nr:class I SAM-dependent methyltransferase [Luteibacter aegosomatissinici]UPG93294.1 class I SAM-dependent methyltransferase [Luteibacter aegosomatissinici]